MEARSAVAEEVARACAASFRVPRECSPRMGGSTGRGRGAAAGVWGPRSAPKICPSSRSGLPASTRVWASPKDVPTPIITPRSPIPPRATRPPTPKSCGRRGTSLTGRHFPSRDYPVKTYNNNNNNSNNDNGNDREYNSENDETKSRESSFYFYFSFRRRVSRPSVTKHGNSKYHIPRTPTTSTGIDSSITDEIWTSANEAKFFRTSTTSTGIGSSLNLHENNRSLESRDADFYSTDIEDSKDTYRRFFPNTPTTSGLGSSSDRQSVETRRGSKDLPDHLWAAAMEDGFSRFNAMKSLQTITRQPRPNHDWVKTERISRFTKHRTIGQSPQREEEIWTSKLNESNVSTYATQRMNGPHKCHHQTRRSFSTSIVADLAVTPDGSQQSLGSGEFLVSFLSLDVVSRCCAYCAVDELRLSRFVFIISKPERNRVSCLFSYEAIRRHSRFYLRFYLRSHLSRSARYYTR